MNAGSGPQQPFQPAPHALPAAAPSWDDLQLLHASLPEIDLDEVDCSLVFLSSPLRLPLLIDATGAPAALVPALARAAEHCGAELVADLFPPDPATDSGPASLAIARSSAPDAVLCGAIGASQLPVRRDQPEAVAALRSALRETGAAALAVQLDVLDPGRPTAGLRAQGLAATLAVTARELQLPLIVRVGRGGLTREAAQRLRDCGATALDAGGRDAADPPAVGPAAFQDWGVPTAASVINAVAAGLPVIAGSGVRHGLDAARALAAGATLVAVREPLLQAATDGDEAAIKWIEQFQVELCAAMFLTGSPTLAELRRRRPVILGATLEWLKRQQEATAS